NKLMAAYNNRGYTKACLGQIDHALEDLNMAIELAPESNYPYDSRGFAYLKAGEWELAKADFDKAISLDASLSEDEEVMAHVAEANKQLGIE
ncbi:MAG: hypothetical protein AAFN11_19240, partial [Chloroflexota bacterium]